MTSIHRTPGATTRNGLVWALALWVGLIALAPSASAQVNVGDATQVGDTVGNVVGTVGDTTGAVGDTTGSAGDTTGAVGDTTGSAGNIVSDTTNTVGDAVTDAGNTVGNAVTDTGNTVGNAVGGDTGGTVSGATGSLGGSIKTTTNDAGSTIKSTGNKAAATADEAGSNFDGILGRKSGSSYDVPGMKSNDTRFGATKVKGREFWNIRGMSGTGATFVGQGFAAFAPSILSTSQLGDLASQTRLLSGPSLAEVARAAQEAIKQFTFPIALTLMVVAFMLGQGRVDRKDPKLALAAVDTDEDMLSFV